jgi:hypothetical protein
VRTLSGEGESIFEGIYALRKRFRGAQSTMAEAYGWGKLLGMTAPWIVDWASRALGVDVYGVQGFYIPYLYSMSDQLGANVSGLLFLRREEGSWEAAVTRYVRHPVLLGQPHGCSLGTSRPAAGAGDGVQPHHTDLYRLGNDCRQSVLGSTPRRCVDRTDPERADRLGMR